MKIKIHREGPIYAEDITGIIEEGCGNPECKEKHDDLVMGPACHPTHPVKVWIKRGSTHAFLVCATCNKAVVSFAVASKFEQSAVSE